MTAYERIERMEKILLFLWDKAMGRGTFTHPSWDGFTECQLVRQIEKEIEEREKEKK